MVCTRLLALPQDLNILFLGGLMVAVVIEHSQLHRRIALTILRMFGTNPRLLMLGELLIILLTL